MNAPIKVFIETLGCKANASESEDIARRFADVAIDYTNRIEEADIAVINSCTVTEEADRQSVKKATFLRKQNPKLKVIFTGCGAEVLSNRAQVARDIDFIVGNQDKPRIAALVSSALRNEFAATTTSGAKTLAPQILGSVSAYREYASHHPMDREWPVGLDTIHAARLNEFSETSATKHRTRVFLKVQEGCDSFCTYCIIPYGRGPARSVPKAELFKIFARFHEERVPEVVLTGTNLGEYGVDQGTTLDALLSEIGAKKFHFRLRLSSLDPNETSDTIIGLMRDEKFLAPHFHLSLQSASSGVLKRMKRKYTVDDARNTLEKISRASPRLSVPIFVGMDIITGFPGETDAEFSETLAFLNATPWTRLHVFPYSERANTPATKIRPVVPREVRHARAGVLRALSESRFGAWISAWMAANPSGSLQVLPEGQVVECATIEKKWGKDVVRGDAPFYRSGHTDNYVRIYFPVETLAPPPAHPVRVSDVRPYYDAQKQEWILIGGPGVA